MNWRRLLPNLNWLNKNKNTKKTISKSTMGDRFFPNSMPDFVEESTETKEEEEAKCGDDRLLYLLRLPYASAAEEFLQAASTLKDEIVRETWINAQAAVRDFSLYTGSLGTAYLCFKAYEVTQNPSDLSLCTQIVESCATAARGMREYVTFICGQAGVYALGAVAAKYSGNQQLLEHYLSLFKKIPKWFESYDVPYELLYGRAGFLWAAAFLNKYVGAETISSSTMAHVVDDILRAGKSLSHKDCPLMYEWHGKKYWGAAHGLAGIMHVLMHFQLSKEAEKDVKGTLRYMIEHRFPSGNYPSSEGNRTDRLVHWCHGAPGVAITLCKAAQVFPEDKDFQEAALDAGEVVWNRGLLRRVGICHGISGNSYVFLALYRLTGDRKHLYRAKAFASFLLDRANALISAGQMHGGDHPYSLFEGLAGTAHLWYDISRPLEAKFPAYEL